MSSLRTACTHCGVELNLKSDKSVGFRVTCPKCGQPFVVQLLEEDWEEVDGVGDEAEDYDGGDDEYDDDTPHRSAEHRSGSRSSQGRRPAKRRQPPKKPAGLSPLVFIGGGVAVIVLAVVVVAVAFRPAGPELGEDFVPPKPGGETAAVAGTFTDAELTQLGQRFAEAINSRQPPQVTAVFDMQSLGARCTSGLEIPAATIRDLIQGMSIGMSRPGGLSSEFCTNVADNGARFIHHRVVGGEPRVLMRVINQDESVNYLELIPHRVAANAPVTIGDLYLYTSGELLSDTLRRLVIPMAAGLNPGLLDRLNGAERDARNFADNLTKLNQLRLTRPPQEVVAFIDTLPQATRESKAVALTRVRMAASLDEQTYAQAMDDYRRLFPNDVSLDLILLDYYFLKEDWDATIGSLDRLDAAMGGDAYLRTMKGMVLRQQKKLPEALKANDEALAVEPDFAKAVADRLETVLELKDWQETLNVMKRLRTEQELVFEDAAMAGSPLFTEFLQTPQCEEYRRFLAEFGR